MDRHDARHPLVWEWSTFLRNVPRGQEEPRATLRPAAPGAPSLQLVLAPQPWEGPAHTPRCITLRECMCSTALHSCTKYFHTVLSGMSRFCFLKYCGGGDRQTDRQA